MNNKIQKLSEPLSQPRFGRAREAWGSYKSLLRSSPRGAMVGLGVAAGYGAFSEGSDPITSSMVLGPALMGIGAAVGQAGGFGMMRKVGAQVARDINTTIRAPYDTGAHPDFLSRTVPSTDYVGKAGRAVAGMGDQVPMHLQYAAVAAKMNTVPGEDRIVTLGELAQDKQLGGFAGKFSTEAAIMAEANESPEFARQFASRAGDFKGMTDIGSMVANKPAGKARFISKTRSGLVQSLREQGHGALASEISDISRDVRITGIATGAGDSISALQYESGGQSFRAPIVGPDGTVKAGLFSRNTNVARKQIFIGSLEGMAAGGTPEVVAMDVAVAKTMRTYHTAAKEVRGGRQQLFNYLADISNLPFRGLPGGMGTAKGMGSAMAWSSPYRMDRIGVPTSANVAIRGMDAQLSMPGRGLLKAFNLEGFMDRDIVSADTLSMLRRSGLAPLGSESASRTNTFVNIERMAGLFPGSYMTPMDKAARGIRDYTKPYYISGGGAMQRRPFASRQLGKTIGKSQGLAMHYNAIFESEAEYLSGLLNTGRKAGKINPGTNKMLESIMGGSMTGTELRELRAGLSHIANMREGQFAAAIPQSAMMVTDVEKIMYTVPEDIMNLKSGSAMPSNRPVGYDAANRPVQHTYSRFGGGGTARFKGITALEEGGRTAYLVRWAEEQSAANVKWGSDVGKMYALSMKESQTPLVMKFINNLRRNKSLRGQLYGNQAYAPLIGAGAANVAEAFTLAGTFGKIQGGPEVLLSTINESFMLGPNIDQTMNKAGRKQFQRLLRQNRMRIGRSGGIVSNFRGTADIEAAHRAAVGFAERMVASPTSFGLGAGTFAGIGEGVSAPAAVLMRGGIVSEAMAWDALNINVPKNVPISTNQLSILNQYGMSASVKELLGRRKMTGDAQATQAYKLALSKFAKPGASMPSNMPIMGIEEFPLSLGAADWRNSARVQENFLINLEVAGSKMNAGLRKALGVSSLHIPVPGVNTDFWHAPYRTTIGSYASSESWTGPLQNLLRSVDEMHQGQDRGVAARNYLSQYLRAIRTTDANLTVGRGGTVYDAGASVAGRMSFRDYSKLYSGHDTLGGRASGFLVGVNPKEFARLGGTGDFAEGLFTRFPATTVDPVYLIPDESVALGEMSMDETRRAKMGADFDGDTGYANVVKSEGATNEVRNIVRGGASARAYDEAQDARMLLGGVADDLSLLGEASRRSGMSKFSNVAAAVSTRFSKFTGIFNQTEGELLAKSYTQYIGRFSNLANEYIMAGTAMDAGAQIARSQLLRDIQQAAIDFGRKSKGRVDPSKISNMLSKAVELASAGDIDGANAQFSYVMEKLAVGTELDSNLGILRSTYAGDTTRIAGLETLSAELESARTGFFNPMRGNTDMQGEFGRLAEAQGIFQRRVYTTAAEAGSHEEVRDALIGLRTHLDAQERLASEGMPSVGRGSAGAGAQVTGLNRATAKARGTKHILDDVWKTMRASPHYGTARAGVLATGALVLGNALFNSPSDMAPPAYEGRQRALQQSPDVAMAGMGGAPMPGSAYGHAHRGGEIRSPRRIDRPTAPQNTIPRRYYVNQTNRVPRIRLNGSGDPDSSNQFAAEMGAHMQRMAGGSSQINVVHDATSRRMSELEFQDKMRNDLRGGR